MNLHEFEIRKSSIENFTIELSKDSYGDFKLKEIPFQERIFNGIKLVLDNLKI